MFTVLCSISWEASKMTARRVVILKNGKQVASGKNLEVLSRYARKHPVTWSSSSPALTSSIAEGVTGIIKVHFKDGAYCTTQFASLTVARNWLATKRKRSGWK
jgi:ABC-type multidrug transport system ATPase subunit